MQAKKQTGICENTMASGAMAIAKMSPCFTLTGNAIAYIRLTVSTLTFEPSDL